jgi:nitrate reductase gamma subunit
MTMTIFLYGFIYAAALVFLIACVVRTVRYARLPLHLRWELYPVPHEEPARAKHGGSYFEETDWWKKPTPFNLIGELKSMLPEMLFQKGLWEFNRTMWFLSFPFHFGLYLIIGSTALLMATALFSLLAPQLASGGTGLILHYACAVGWLAGAALAVAGAASLLVRRLTNENLKTYTTAGDIFNLLFFIVTLGCLLAGYLLQPLGAPKALALAQGILTFDTKLRIPALLATGLVLGVLLVAYIPMTHMSHFIAKYFTYHTVRWDDRPSLKGSVLEKRMAEYLTYRPRWAAPHVGADGARTWAEIALANPAQGSKK